MTLPQITSDRFIPETGHRILVQVPEQDSDRILAAIIGQDLLTYGDYDQVSFSTKGIQRFRATGEGYNAATESTVEVPCVELSVFTCAEPEQLAHIIKEIYAAHPYEEPVIQVVPALRTCHRRGMDEDNPNRFWNRKTADWVPKSHRRSNLG